MHLRTLTLRGLKSFASATTLHLEPGITCVAGSKRVREALRRGRPRLGDGRAPLLADDFVQLGVDLVRDEAADVPSLAARGRNTPGATARVLSYGVVR